MIANLPVEFGGDVKVRPDDTLDVTLILTNDGLARHHLRLDYAPLVSS